jgi:hypothetical protein
MTWPGSRRSTSNKSRWAMRSSASWWGLWQPAGSARLTWPGTPGGVTEGAFIHAARILTVRPVVLAHGTLGKLEAHPWGSELLPIFSIVETSPVAIVNFIGVSLGLRGSS